MKQLFAKCALAVAMLLGAAASLQAQQAFYVYRNDGMINGFITSDIDSMQCSRLDVDSLLHADFQVQEIYTPDSIYRIPLTVIDSISFVTPEPVYQPGVVNISDELMAYAVSCDSLTITFMASTPAGVLPKVNDKLVTLEMNEVFPAGFAGKVKSISNSTAGIVVECELADLQEIFETYYNVTSVYGYQEEDGTISCRTRRPLDGGVFVDKEIDFGSFSISGSSEVAPNLFGSESLALKGGSQLEIGVTPVFHAIASLIIRKGSETYFSTCIFGDISVEEKISLYGGIDFSKQWLDQIKPKAAIAPGVFLYVNPGIFFNAGGQVSISGVNRQRFYTVTAFDYSSLRNNMLQSKNSGRMISSSVEIEGCLEGCVTLGAFLEFGVEILDSKISKLCCRGELGCELVGDFVFFNSDISSASKETKVYEMLKNSSVDVNAFYSLSLIGEIKPMTINFTPFRFTKNLQSFDLVPTFSTVSLEPGNPASSSAVGKAELSGQCSGLLGLPFPEPVDVGFSLRDEDGVEVRNYFYPEKFSNGTLSMTNKFDGLETNKKYILYPKVKKWGFDILASPTDSLVVEPRKCPVKISGFQMENSYHVPGGFTNGDVMYDYRFECVVGISFYSSIDLNGLDDWGYVYEDPQGNITHISHSKFSVSNNTDRSYAFYRNNAHSQVRLYGYVKYKGDDEYYYDDPKDYELVHLACPDKNHPHMIDLGLPSGTMWSCCNVDATAPKEVGSFYAWGETEPTIIVRGAQDGYYWSEYQYGNGTTVTKYCTDKEFGKVDNKTVLDPMDDVAYMKWGNGWHMPTREEAEELFAYCNCEWVSFGKPFGESYFEEGLLVTGPNGNLLYMPVGRSDWGYTADAGNYWTSSLDKKKNNYALSFYFQNSSNGFYFQYGNARARCRANLIRPVIR